MTDQKTPLSVEIRHATSALDLNVDRATLYRWADDSASLEAKLADKYTRLREAQKPVAVSDRLPTEEDGTMRGGYTWRHVEVWDSRRRCWIAQILDACEATNHPHDGKGWIDYPGRFTHWRRIDNTPPEKDETSH